MGQWLPEDMTAKALPLPAAVESRLSDDTPRELTGKMWCALRGCYATEADAISAAERSMSTILPYLNRPSNIYGSYDVLCNKLGADGAREIIRKNPNVLSCNPVELAKIHARFFGKASAPPAGGKQPNAAVTQNAERRA